MPRIPFGSHSGLQKSAPLLPALSTSQSRATPLGFLAPPAFIPLQELAVSRRHGSFFSPTSSTKKIIKILPCRSTPLPSSLQEISPATVLGRHLSSTTAAEAAALLTSSFRRALANQNTHFILHPGVWTQMSMGNWHCQVEGCEGLPARSSKADAVCANS